MKLIVLTGEEFRCSLKIDAIKNEYRETELNIHKEFAVQDAYHLFQSPLLARNNVFIMEYKIFAKLLETIDFEKVPDSTLLITYTNELDKRTKAFKYIKDHAEVLSYPDMSEQQTMAWLRKVARNKEIDIESSAMRLLIMYLGVHPRALYSELIKLHDMAKLNNDSSITEKYVKLNTSVEKDFKLYELSNNIFDKNLRESYFVYKFLRNTFDSFGVVRYLQNHILKLIYAKTAKELLTGMQPYIADKICASVRKISMSKLEKMLFLCLGAEVSILEGVDKDVVLKELIYSLLV